MSRNYELQYKNIVDPCYLSEVQRSTILFPELYIV